MHRALFVLCLACFSLIAFAGDLEKGLAAYQSGNLALALETLRPLAERGDRQAQYLVGSMFLGGLGVEHDPAEAGRWLHMAVREGLPPGEDPPPEVVQAQSMLGVLYMYGAGVEKDLDAAIHWLELAAASGDVDAQQNRGAVAVATKDYPTARKFFELAAAQGNSEAEKNLGAIYQFGWGVEKDFDRALAFFRKAASKGNLDAIAAIGNMHEKGEGVSQDPKQAFRWYFAAAERGHPGAQQRVARQYLLGSGVGPSEFEAYRWVLISSSDGDPNTMTELAKLATLISQEEIERARASALEWRPFEGSLDESLARADAAAKRAAIAEQEELANLMEETWKEVTNQPVPPGIRPSVLESAEAGRAAAQVELGRLHETGTGVEKNLPVALDWYRKAAAQGHYQAELKLGQFYEEGLGVTRDNTQALQWYRRSAEKGVPDAQSRLGSMLAEGRGVAKDLVEADLWLGLAAEVGVDDARHARDRLRQTMSPEQLEKSKQRILDYREWEQKEAWPASEASHGLDPDKFRDVTKPKKTGGPSPEYPELARVARIESRVVLNAVIGVDGTVRSASLLECWTTDSSGLGRWGQLNRQDPPGGICSMFEESASKAVMDWRFDPAMKAGEPVEVYFNVRVDFRLK